MTCGPAKIVFVNRYFYPDQSATSQLLTDLAAALVQAGGRVHVICSRQRYDDANARLPATDVIRGVVVHRVWGTCFGRDRLWGRALDYGAFYLAGTVAMMRLLNRGDIIVAKTDPPLISIPAMAVAKIRGASLVNWLQDIFPEVATALSANPFPRVLDSLLRRLRDWSLHSARFNVVLGERMQARLQQAGVSLAKIRVIPNWAEAAPAAPKMVECSDLRARLELSNAFVVGYSGNLGRAHDFRTVFDAAQLLRSETDIVFLMIGGGATMAQLQRSVTDAGLDNFRFLPYQSRELVSDSLAAADVHWVTLVPSLEGLIVPSKYYGILAAARPVVFIGDADGELARDIRSAVCGDAVAIGAAQELATLLQKWKADPQRRSLMGRNGHQRYLEQYCAARAFKQWSLVIEQTVKF